MRKYMFLSAAPQKYESYGKYFEREVDLGDDFDDNDDIYIKGNDEQSKSG